jgi:photosystem II stability/assembly factor-like uncharacterized protein
MNDIGLTPAQTGQSRVFTIEGRADPETKPNYEACARAGAPDYAFGDVTSIEAPDPTAHNRYIDIGEIQGAEGRPTMDLVGKYALDVISRFLRLAKKRCAIDALIVFGECTDPTDFDSFDKILVMEDAKLTNWSAGDLGTLGSDGAASVEETAPLSARDMYELLPLTLRERGADVVAQEVLDVVRCDTPACGECDDESDGCEKFYAITAVEVGSPGTPPDILSTPDKGVTWYADDIDSLGAAEAPSAISCLRQYVVVVSNDSASLHYALKSEVDRVGYDETWTEVTTGFVAGGEPNHCRRAATGTILFIVGDTGYIYKCEDPLAGVTVLDAGAATTEDLRKVAAFSDTFVVAAGDNGSIVWADDGASFQAAETSPVGGGVRITALAVKSKNEWWVGTSAGELWYTKDQAVSWTLKGDYGEAIYDIVFATDTEAFFASTTSTPLGRIHRSVNGGYSWYVIPEGLATIPANDRINALAACKEDPNLVMGVGLADDASDGFIVVGGASG